MTDVVIIGGGVIGLAIAREASRSGLETIVLEKNELASQFEMLSKFQKRILQLSQKKNPQNHSLII